MFPDAKTSGGSEPGINETFRKLHEEEYRVRASHRLARTGDIHRQCAIHEYNITRDFRFESDNSDCLRRGIGAGG
jgi:hypothetical protein